MTQAWTYGQWEAKSVGSKKGSQMGWEVGNGTRWWMNQERHRIGIVRKEETRYTTAPRVSKVHGDICADAEGR